MVEWAGLSVEQVETHWPEIESVLSPAMGRRDSDFLPADILLGAKKGEFQIWIVYGEAISAVVVTEIIAYPSRKVCLVKMLAGREINAWLHLLDSVLIPWAKAAGCSVIRGYCRPGLKRFLDWKQTKVVMEKVLT